MWFAPERNREWELVQEGRARKRQKQGWKQWRSRPSVMATAEGHADFSVPGLAVGTDWERGELRAQTVVGLWDLEA